MYRILIADDEPIERMVVCKIIKEYFPEQLEIVQAVNGREAVELFEKEQCRIALLDIEMPGINGLEAAERIRSNDSTCSIIFLTAFDEFSYAKRAIAVKALDYLLKPGSVEELVAVLEEAIRLEDKQQASMQDTMQAGNENSASAKSEVDESDAANANKDKEDKEEMAEKLRMHAVAENIRIYIETHYMEDISLQDVAQEMNYSDAYFCKLFKQCFDKSFVTYLTDFRVNKAKELLADVMVNIKDVSMKVGYHDSNYFAKVFKRVVGVTPSEYRLQVLQKEDGTVR